MNESRTIRPVKPVAQRFDKLTPTWPEHRPLWISHLVDWSTSTVYVTNGRGNKMLAIPFKEWLRVASEIEED